MSPSSNKGDTQLHLSSFRVTLGTILVQVSRPSVSQMESRPKSRRACDGGFTPESALGPGCYVTRNPNFGRKKRNQSSLLRQETTPSDSEDGVSNTKLTSRPLTHCQVMYFFILHAHLFATYWKRLWKRTHQHRLVV